MSEDARQDQVTVAVLPHLCIRAAKRTMRDVQHAPAGARLRLRKLGEFKPANLGQSKDFHRLVPFQF
jgi:hypothetical protein